MKRSIIPIFIAIAISVLVFDAGYQYYSQKSNSLPIPPKLFAGEIHYSRIPVEYWEHRIQMVKALGLNSLSVYIMWNYHETEKGVFDYQTGNRNLSLFLDLAEKYQMKVLFRPGPYVCAEWDFGGFPARLLAIQGLILRANNQKYLDQVLIYFKSLVPIIKKHQYTEQNPKGSITLLQIQNQYGFYGTDKSYIEALRKIWTDLGIDTPQYYVDWASNIMKCHWSGANIGINDGVTQSQWDFAREFQRTGYLLGGQIYSGWLTHWYEPWQAKSISKNQLQFGFLMKNNHSYSMYMVHGGSNFGLTAGANAFVGQKYNYRPHVTSYDYDAPINEQGSSTQKFVALRDLIKKYADWSIPQIPEPINTIEIDKFLVTKIGSLTQNLGSPAVSGSTIIHKFESQTLLMFNQGIAVYQTFLVNRTYFFRGIVHDYAIVELDGVYIATLDRSVQLQHNFKVNCQKSNCTLRIIVEAMGHINFDHQMENDFKGLIDIDDDLSTIFKWNIYKVPVDESIFKWNKNNSNTNQTVLFKGTVTVAKTGDTYLDMSAFNKGYVWVNNNNLGRYWKVGPQTRLFCPGVWLKQGENTVYVLQMLYQQQDYYITGKKTLTN